MTEESLARFAEKMIALYGGDGQFDVWLDSLEDLRTLEAVFIERGYRTHLNAAKLTLLVVRPDGLMG